MFTFIHSVRLKLAVTFATLSIAACGGGDSALPPAGGLTLDPGDQQITVSWKPDSGVEYWLGYVAGTSVSLAVGAAHKWVINVSSPYVLTGLSNGTPYAFSLNGRTDGGPGGEGTPSLSSTPRPGGATWKTGNTMGTAGVRGVTYGTASDSTVNYVAVGDAGAIYKGTDGVNWTAVATGPMVDFRAVGYTFSKFITLGSSGQIYYSADIATWTAASSSTSNSLNALASSSVVAIAVGDNGTIRYSTDGVTWLAAASVPTSEHLYGVTYAASGIWIAVGAKGTLLTSADGSTWVAQASGTSAKLNSIATQLTTLTGVYTYVAVGAGGTVVTSNNSTAWTSAAVNPTVDLSAVVVPSTQSQFLAVGAAGHAFTSPDGITWTARTPSVAPSNCAAADWRGLVTAQAQYVAVGSGGANCNSH